MSQYNEITEKKYCRANLSKIHLPLGGSLESLGRLVQTTAMFMEFPFCSDGIQIVFY